MAWTPSSAFWGTVERPETRMARSSKCGGSIPADLFCVRCWTLGVQRLQLSVANKGRTLNIESRRRGVKKLGSQLMASDTDALQKQHVPIFRQKVSGMTGRDGSGKSRPSVGKAGLSAQTAIARHHAPGTRLPAPCRRAGRCRRQSRLPGNRW